MPTVEHIGTRLESLLEEKDIVFGDLRPDLADMTRWPNRIMIDNLTWLSGSAARKHEEVDILLQGGALEELKSPEKHLAMAALFHLNAFHYAWRTGSEELADRYFQKLTNLYEKGTLNEEAGSGTEIHSLVSYQRQNEGEEPESLLGQLAEAVFLSLDARRQYDQDRKRRQEALKIYYQVEPPRVQGKYLAEGDSPEALAERLGDIYTPHVVVPERHARSRTERLPDFQYRLPNGEIVRVIQGLEAKRRQGPSGNRGFVISSLTRTLGEGNMVWPQSGLPEWMTDGEAIMRGKGFLYLLFAGAEMEFVDMSPAVRGERCHDPEEWAAEVARRDLTGFLWNLEDTAYPHVFNILKTLRNRYPNHSIFCDDSDGTRMVVMACTGAGIEVVGKEWGRAKALVLGAGTAGGQIALALARRGVNTVVFDSKGALFKERAGLDEHKLEIVQRTNPDNFLGSFEEALRRYQPDIVIEACSTPNRINAEFLARNVPLDVIAWGLTNPIPGFDPMRFLEIMYERAQTEGSNKRPVVGTGRGGRIENPVLAQWLGGNLLNMINNNYGFPHLGRAALDGCFPLDDTAFEAYENSAARVIGKSGPLDVTPNIWESDVSAKMVRMIRGEAAKAGLERWIYDSRGIIRPLRTAEESANTVRDQILNYKERSRRKAA